MLSLQENSRALECLVEVDLVCIDFSKAISHFSRHANFNN